MQRSRARRRNIKTRTTSRRSDAAAHCRATNLHGFCRPRSHSRVSLTAASPLDGGDVELEETAPWTPSSPRLRRSGRVIDDADALASLSGTLACLTLDHAATSAPAPPSRSRRRLDRPDTIRNPRDASDELHHAGDRPQNVDLAGIRAPPRSQPPRPRIHPPRSVVRGKAISLAIDYDIRIRMSFMFDAAVAHADHPASKSLPDGDSGECRARLIRISSPPLGAARAGHERPRRDQGHPPHELEASARPPRTRLAGLRERLPPSRRGPARGSSARSGPIGDRPPLRRSRARLAREDARVPTDRDGAVRRRRGRGSAPPASARARGDREDRPSLPHWSRTRSRTHTPEARGDPPTSRGTEERRRIPRRPERGFR